MVGPVSDRERASFARKVKAALTLVVGASAGLVALANGAAPEGVAVAAAGGLIVGAALVRIVFPGDGAVVSRSERR